MSAKPTRPNHVRGVDGSLGRARPDDGVELVDEEDDLSLGLFDVLEDGLQPLLELAAVLRAREECADVERPHASALEPLGNVARDDALREPFDDRGLAHARIADEHGVVLRPAGEDLDDAANLLVPADDGVELPGLGEIGEVTAELLERLVGALGVLRGHSLRAAHLLERGEERIARRHVQREQQVLRRDVLILELAHLVLGLVQDAREVGRRLRLLRRALYGGLLRQLRLALGALRFHRLPGTFDQGPRQLLVEERDAEVLGVDLGIAPAARQLLGCGDGLSRLDRQTVEIHTDSSVIWGVDEGGLPSSC